MDHLEKLERLLGFSLQCLDDAAGEVRASPELDTDTCLKHVGSAIVAAWELRDKVHAARPSLRPDFVSHYAASRDEYERFDQLAENALSAERNGENDQATKLWSELSAESVPSHFRIQAQAGMWRLRLHGV